MKANPGMIAVFPLLRPALLIAAAGLLSAPPVRADAYQGPCQVVSGPGTGQPLAIAVDYDGRNLRTLAGPSLAGAEVHVDPRGEFLELTILRGQQVVHCVLRQVPR